MVSNPSRYRACALALLGVLLAGCAAGGAVGASPSAQVSNIASSPSATGEATETTEWTTYTSDRYQYSIEYPSDWQMTPASRDWPAEGSSYPDDDAIDKWTAPSASPSWVLMFVSSVAMPGDETPEERIAKLDGDNANFCDLDHRRAVTVGAIAARREDGKCFGADYIDEVALINDGRFYLVYVLSAAPLSAATAATFEHFFESLLP